MEDFEEKAYALKPVHPLEVLREWIDSNGLKQEICSTSSGLPASCPRCCARDGGLTVEHIRKLSQRFHVSRDVFLGEFGLSRICSPMRFVY
jgi:antitoxin component HigA of HigAB toxin-antitoxin module